MMKFLTFLFFLFFTSNVFGQNSEKIFTIRKYPDGTYKLKSCLSPDMYNPKVIFPLRKERVLTKKEPPLPGSMILKDSEWEGDCILVNVDPKAPTQELKHFLLALTLLDEYQIVIQRDYILE